jgi:hypothetical protein
MIENLCQPNSFSRRVQTIYLNADSSQASHMYYAFKQPVLPHLERKGLPEFSIYLQMRRIAPDGSMAAMWPFRVQPVAREVFP